MPYNVHITDTATGETRVSRDESDWVSDHDEGESPGWLHTYMWGEGNYACDCNRSLFFARAAGEDDPDHECGQDRFSVRITDDDGVELYRDCSREG